MKKGFLNNKKQTKKQRIVKAKATEAHTQFPGEIPQDAQLASFMEQKMGVGSNSVVKLDSGFVGIKLPIGKVDTTLPKDYVPSTQIMQLYSAAKANYNDKHLVYTTIPPRFPDETSADIRDGWSECLFYGGKQKRAILSTPGFPSPVPKPPQTRYRIGPSTHGLGMFATRDLAAYDLIVAERPLLVFPSQNPVHPSFFSGSVTVAQAIQMGLADQEEALKVCIDRMTPERRQAFFALHNCHTQDGSGPIVGRTRTNGIGFSIDLCKDDKSLSDNSGTFDSISRVNHSCVPNATYKFQDSSFSLKLVAIRPIKKGEEILISYAAQSLTRDKRQEALLPYGFSCACEACLDPDRDALLASILNSIDNSNIFYSKDPRKMLEESVPWIKKIEDAKLEDTTEYNSHILRAYTLSLQLGEKAQAEKYWKKYEGLFAADSKLKDMGNLFSAAM